VAGRTAGATVLNAARASPVEAAALVPVYRDGEGEMRLVLVHRAEGGIHGGQLALPGGKRDAQDASMLDTALREAWEEIGLARERIQVLAELPPAETRTTGFRILPFLARIVRPAQWRPDAREVAEIIEVKLSELARPGAHAEEVVQLPGWPAPRSTPFYRVGPHRLWGVTYRIVDPLLPRLLAGEWNI
jgi:8-oxo-dGTP pyrophosphatase MutT (NUDIX family)